jgi:hypothetical protein
MSHLRLERFIAIDGDLIGIRLTKPNTTGTELKMIDRHAVHRKESPARHHLCLALHTMRCTELTAYLWILQSAREQQINLVAMRWEVCEWSNDGDRKPKWNIPYFHKLAGMFGAFPTSESRRAALRALDDERDSGEVRLQVTPLREGRSAIGFDLALFDSQPLAIRDQTSGIRSAAHFNLPPDVTPDRVLLWYGYPPDARDRLLRINPEAPTVVGQELCIAEYLGTDLVEEVRLASVGNSGGSVDMSVFPMTIHPTAEAAREVQRRGCIDPLNCTPAEVGMRLDFLAEGTSYTSMKCCPISDLDNLPPPIVGKKANLVTSAVTTGMSFVNPNPNPRSPNLELAGAATSSSGSVTLSKSGTSTPGSTSWDVTTWEQQLTTTVDSKISAQLVTLTSALHNRANQQLQQYRDAFRREIQAGQEQTQEQIRQMQIGQERITAQVRSAEEKANAVAEQSRLGIESLQALMRESMQNHARQMQDHMDQQSNLTKLVMATQQAMQAIQIQQTGPHTQSEGQPAGQKGSKTQNNQK